MLQRDGLIASTEHKRLVCVSPVFADVVVVVVVVVFPSSFVGYAPCDFVCLSFFFFFFLILQRFLQFSKHRMPVDTNHIQHWRYV